MLGGSQPPLSRSQTQIGDVSKTVSGHSPRSIRRGNADPVDINPAPVKSETGELNHDKNTRQPYGIDPWAESH
jgi:hypothetical protein